MSLQKKKYLIHGYRQDYWLTAQRLYERVMKDINKSNYKWIASDAELIQVCEQPDFPEEYEKEIKIAILNSFTNYESRHSYTQYYMPINLFTAARCYNTLSGEDKKAAAVKQRYLTVIVEKFVEYQISNLEIDKLSQSEIAKCERWEKEILTKYSSMEQIDFREFLKEIRLSFNETMNL